MRKALYGTLAFTLVLAVAHPIRAAWVEQTLYPDIIDGTVAALTNDSKFPNDPTFSFDPTPLIYSISPADPFEPRTVVEGFSGGTGTYGSMIQGWLEAPVTGVYTFWVSSSQDSSFYLSTNGTMAGQQLIASVSLVSMGPRIYTATPTQRSSYYYLNGITLTKGNQYYFRVLQANAQRGGHHVSIGWYRPDGVVERPIPVRYVQKFPAADNGFGGFYFDTQKSQAPAVMQLPGYRVSGSTAPGGILSHHLNVIEGSNVVLFANMDGSQPMTYQWHKNGAIMTGEVLSSLDVNATTVNYTGDQFECRATNSLGNATAQIRLTVQPDTTKPLVVSAARMGNPAGLSVFFSEPVNPLQATNPANYRINVATVTGAQLQYGTNPSVVILTTTPLAGWPITMSVTNVQDLATTPNKLATPNSTSVGLVDGIVQRFKYSGIGGVDLMSLYNATNQWPSNPDVSDFSDALETPTNIDDNYGTELKGVIVPPETGNYVFFIAGDDQAVMYLSTDDTAANKKAICVEPQWADFRDWPGAQDRRINFGGLTFDTWQGTWTVPAAVNGGVAANRSDNIAHGFTTPGSSDVFLMAGRRYYFEAAMKEGGGGDSLAVTWLRPSETASYPPPTPANGTAPIPGQFLGLSAQSVGALAPVAITAQPSDLTVEERFDATFAVEAAGSVIGCYQWYEDTAQGPKMLVDANSATLRFSTLGDDNGRKFFCVAWNAFSKVASRTNTLTVVADTTKPRVYRVVGSPDFNTFTVMFSEPLDRTTAQTVSNYRLTRTGQQTQLGISSPTVQNQTNVVLTFTAANGHLPGVSYTLTMQNVGDQATAMNVVVTTNVTWTGFVLSRGFLRTREFWRDFGPSLDQVRNWLDTGVTPSRERILPSYESHYPEDNLPDWPNFYGQQIYGYIIPPVVGTYQFYVCSDDNSRFYVSTDGNPANRQLVASEPEWNYHRQWLEGYNQASRGIPPANIGTFHFPVANVPYYTEILHQENYEIDIDNAAATWQEPGGAPVVNLEEPRLRGAVIASYQNPDGTALSFTTDLPGSLTNNEGSQTTLAVATTGSYYDVPNATVIYQWETAPPGGSTFTPINGANSATYTTAFLFPGESGRKYRCTTFIPGKSLTSTTTTLTVNPDAMPPSVSAVFGTETLNQIVVRFSERVTAATAGIIGAYAVTGGLAIQNAALQANGTDVILTTTAQTPGTQYMVQVTGVKDASVAGNTISPNPMTKTFTAWQLYPGWVKRKAWFSSWEPLWSMVELTNSTRYPDNPDLVDYLPTFETVWSGDGWREMGGFGQEIEYWGWTLEGWLTVPTTGDYIFVVTSDDQGLVYLSTDHQPANQQLICADPEWNGQRDWYTPDRRNGNPDLFPGRQRVNWSRYVDIVRDENGNPTATNILGATGNLIRLTNGVPYYLRTITHDVAYGDHISLAMALVMDPYSNGDINNWWGDKVIPASVVSTWANPDNTVTFAAQPQNCTVVDGQNTTVSVAANANMLGLYPAGSSPDGPAQTWPRYQWQYSDNGGATWMDVPSSLPGEGWGQMADYTTPYLTLAQQGRRYRCAVSIPGKTTYSEEATMTIVPPSLQITRVGTNAIVSWPAVPSYVLQSTNALPGGATGWKDETNDIGLQGTVPMGSYLLTNPTATGNKFFELKKP